MGLMWLVACVGAIVANMASGDAATDVMQRRPAPAWVAGTSREDWLTSEFNRGAKLCRNGPLAPAGGGEARPNATLLFLHIFKAAGSTTRDTLKDYAR